MSVTTRRDRLEFPSRSTAFPDSTACTQHASISLTPRDSSAFTTLEDGAAGGDLVVEDERALSLHVTDHVVDLGAFGVVFAAFVEDGERQAQVDGIDARALCAARVGRHHHAVVNARFFLVIFADEFSGEQVVHRDPEEARDLRRMKVHGHHAVWRPQSRGDPR